MPAFPGHILVSAREQDPSMANTQCHAKCALPLPLVSSEPEIVGRICFDYFECSSSNIYNQISRFVTRKEAATIGRLYFEGAELLKGQERQKVYDNCNAFGMSLVASRASRLPFTCICNLIISNQTHSWYSYLIRIRILLVVKIEDRFRYECWLARA